MLSHTQKKYAAYFLAVIDLFLALMLWTRAFAGMERTSLRTAAITEDIIVHPAAPEELRKEEGIKPAVKEQGQIQPAIQETKTDEDSHAAIPDERETWGLTQRYTISIPSLSLRAPVLVPDRSYWDARKWNLLEEQMQVGLLYGAVAYPHSVAPGSKGALIIAGHSSPPDDRAAESAYGRLFSRLPELSVGDDISVRFGSDAVPYVVSETFVVPSGDTSILAQENNESVLKLITCYPVGSTKERLVIIAKVKEQ